MKFLPRLANYNRFIIFPWVNVKNLGFHLLSRIVACLSRDWYTIYEQELLLLEAFVDPCQRPFETILQQKVERGELSMMLRGVGWDSRIVSTLSLTPDEVRVLIHRLIEFVDCFEDCFTNPAQLQHTLAYLKGLASDLPSKSIEPIAIEILGVERVRALQHFITGSTWCPKQLLKKCREDR